jgi:hypothetical protein
LLSNTNTAPIVPTNESLNSNTAPEPSEPDLPIIETGTSSFLDFVFVATNIRKETGNIHMCISYLKNSKPKNISTMIARVFFLESMSIEKNISPLSINGQKMFNSRKLVSDGEPLRSSIIINNNVPRLSMSDDQSGSYINMAGGTMVRSSSSESSTVEKEFNQHEKRKSGRETSMSSSTKTSTRKQRPRNPRKRKK